MILGDRPKLTCVVTGNVSIIAQQYVYVVFICAGRWWIVHRRSLLAKNWARWDVFTIAWSAKVRGDTRKTVKTALIELYCPQTTETRLDSERAYYEYEGRLIE